MKAHDNLVLQRHKEERDYAVAIRMGNHADSKGWKDYIRQKPNIQATKNEEKAPPKVMSKSDTMKLINRHKG